MAQYHEIFVPGGFPRHTYNPRVDLQLEDKLAEVRRNLCKLVTVTGQTKSGKTVLARKVLPVESSIWVDGGTVSTEDDFWHVILDALDLFQEERTEARDETSSKLSGKRTAEANFLVAKGSGEVGGELGKTRGTSRSRGRTLNARVTALNGLREHPKPLVIDDFHYLPKPMQGSIVRALKPLVFDGLSVAIIAIPHRRYDAMKVEREMTGRIYPVEIPIWSTEELEFIPRTGFNLLNYDVEPDACRRLAQEAIGSPHLMQDLCRGVCRLLGIEEASEERLTVAPVPNDIQEVYSEVANTIGRPIFEKLARGPRQRTDRIQRHLNDGRTVDIYELVLHALAHLKPGLVSLEYEDLRAAIRSVSADQVPQLHEVS